MLSDEDEYIPWNPEVSRASMYISNVFVPFGIQHPSLPARVSFDSISPSFDNAAAASTLRNLGPSFDNAAASLRNLREPQESQQLLLGIVCCLHLSLP